MRQKGFSAILILVIVAVLAGVGFIGLKSIKRPKSPDQSESPTNFLQKMTGSKGFTKLSEPKLIFTGGYADPTILQKDDQLIMYLNNFSVQPSTYETHTSTDGLKWTKTTSKLPKASTGRIVDFDDYVRLYYPDQTPIRPSDPPASILSATSTDGFNFTNESGTRIDPKDGYYLEGPTVFKLKDGSYRMYFSENDQSSKEKRVSKIWGATSTDGVSWTRDAKATVDPINAKPWPQALHPFVLVRPDGTYLMFYNTHSEIYAMESKDGIKWTDIGDIGVHGADVDGYYLPDGSIRLYYGDFSESTSGVVYVIDIKEN